MEFVWIKPGTFTMGSPPEEQDRQADEGPQHQVTISRGFYMGKYELTQGQWVAVMGTKPWSGQPYVQDQPSHPAVYITWDDAQAFVHRMNQAAGDSLYRLPTEAEWEYACRAGTTTRWSFGDDEAQLGAYAWYVLNGWGLGLEYSQPVGMKRANPWGLYDIHGNAWEWCQDWYGEYAGQDQVDPAGASTGTYRVIRSADVGNPASALRSALRNKIAPDWRFPGLSTRLVRSR